ncbi:lipopolysaccharide biosynthesis protein [Maribacter sp. 2307UL18-2]|uniref:lipopolysaccharide biosynthesis protein n=1 Tax=Maribacter sp. 2307UL18-2 TaxID=3386274 RepID=UPI0039BC69EC
MGALENQTKKGLVWSSIDKFSTLIIQFSVGIVLARLLSPEDFGLIGMITILISISQCLVDSGFYTALVQKKNITNVDYSTILFFNIVVAFLLYFILYLTADYIAVFYQEPLLIDLIKVVSLNIIILSTTVVHKAMLSKKIDFRIQAIAHIISSVVGGIIGIYAAFNDHGVWALVYHTLSRGILASLLYWFLNRWTPSIVFSKASFKALFSFGSKLMLSELLKIFFRNLFIIIIGKVYKAEELGYYTRASLFKQVPGTLVGNILQSVTFPLMVKVIDNNEKAKHVLVRSTKLTGFVLFPVILWLLFFAKPLILVLLTQKWLPTVLLLQILCLDILFHPMQYINLNYLNAKGRSDLFLKLEMLKNIFTVIAILITYKFGLVAMTVGYISVSCLSFFINSYYTGTYVKYGALKQLADLSPYAIAASFAVIPSFFICFFIPSMPVQLVTGVALCAIFYISIAYTMKFQELFEIKRIILNKI